MAKGGGRTTKEKERERKERKERELRRGSLKNEKNLQNDLMASFHRATQNKLETSVDGLN